VTSLVVVRHAHALSNAGDVVSGRPPGEGLSEQGVAQALVLGELLAGDEIRLGVATQLLRTQETLRLALGARTVSTLVEAGLDEISFGSFEGGPLSAYREWAWASGPAVPCPGGGESRAAAAARLADSLDGLLRRSETTVLAVTHALAVRYVVDAADGRVPAARVEPVEHARPYRLDRVGVERAAVTLRAWARSPRFRDAA
jgi:probable phosphoglycerate mutase